MKKWITAILLAITFVMHSQTPVPKLLAQTPDGKVKAYIGKDTTNDIRLYFVNAENKPDSLIIPGFEVKKDQYDYTMYFLDSCSLSSAQVDGVGLNELLITYYVEGMEHVVGETFDFTIFKKLKQIEIWNIDEFNARPEMLFTARSFYSQDYSHDHATIYLRSRLIGTISEEPCISYYSYDLSINSSGNMLINNLSDTNDIQEKPDHETGLYLFKHGEFHFQKSVGN